MDNAGDAQSQNLEPEDFQPLAIDEEASRDETGESFITLCVQLSSPKFAMPLKSTIDSHAPNSPSTLPTTVFSSSLWSNGTPRRWDFESSTTSPPASRTGSRTIVFDVGDGASQGGTMTRISIKHDI